MRKVTLFISNLFIIALLTILTQVGGLIYLLSFFCSRICHLKLWYQKFIVFLALYLVSTFIIIPPLAKKISNRIPIAHTENVQPASSLTKLLNRNYVKPKLNQLLQNAGKELENETIRINYLDANFPFIDGFRLIPHLSHNDGKKVDISFIYETKEGEISTKNKSISGYGIHENPRKGETDQINNCTKKGHWQYDKAHYLSLGTINSKLQFSNQASKKLCLAILHQKDLSKLFLEPHLKQRWKLKSSKVRYQGCHSVRHDDHIHIQIK